MKKIALLVTLIFSAFSINAQHYITENHPAIGIKGGISASSMSKFDLLATVTPDFKMSTGLHGVLFYELPLGDKFSFQPEVSLITRGFKIDESVNVGAIAELLGSNVGTINLGKLKLGNTYIQVPLLAKMHFADFDKAHVYALLGPQVSFLVGSKLRPQILGATLPGVNMPKGIYKNAEIGGVAGLGAELPLAKNMQLLVEARYDMGFSRALNTPIIKVDVRNYSVSGLFGVKYYLAK